MTSSPPRPATEVARLLAQAGAEGEVRGLPEDGTVAQVAAELGVPVGAVVAGHVFAVDDAPLLVLTSSSHRVDAAHVADLLGVRAVRPAPAEFVGRHTGQPVDAVAPVGHPEPIGTLVDVELARYDRVWAPAGHPGTFFATSYEELLRLTAGTAAEVGGGPEHVDPAVHGAAVREVVGG